MHMHERSCIGSCIQDSNNVSASE
jgi:hypothetical protein